MLTRPKWKILQLASAVICCSILLIAPFAGAADNSRITHAATSNTEPASVSTGVYRLSAQEARTILAEHYSSENGKPRPQLEEVVVAEQMQQLPMHSVAREIPIGLAALYWAAANPSQALRIVLPAPSA